MVSTYLVYEHFLRANYLLFFLPLWAVKFEYIYLMRIQKLTVSVRSNFTAGYQISILTLVKVK